MKTTKGCCKDEWNNLLICHIYNNKLGIQQQNCIWEIVKQILNKELQIQKYRQGQQQMSKLELSHILGSSTSRRQQLGYAQDFLIYVSGSFIIFYSPVVDQQICYLKHSSPFISCITVSPCQKFIAVSSAASSDKQKTLDINNKKNYIVIYKLGEIGVTDPTPVTQLKGHKYAIDHVIFSPDSQYLVSICNKDGSMFVWDCKTGDRITQNKNSKSITCAKFMYQKQAIKPGSKDPSVYLVTSGRGNCKIWQFYTAQSPGTLHKVTQQDQCIIVGKNISLNKKFATKQFIDICFWKSYILLLTSDGLLCMIIRNEKEQKLQKCIDLMITKTTSMDIYRNTIMCGGEGALIKVIDLQTLQLIRKFPRPPPVKKQNISKDYDEQEVISYQQSEQFPQCIGIKTIGNNLFSQFIITIYQNLTMFIWRPQPNQMVAMRSIITHSSAINSVKVLEEFQNDLTFFSTISQDNTLRIWHIYKKCIYNRQSIDIAKLIGINRNAYCRNLTRIIYMESEKQVTCIAGFCKKSVACIAHKQFIMYSLINFEVTCHELLDDDAIALQIKDKIAYIGLSNGKVILYQILQNEDRLNKMREIQFKNKIKTMEIVSDESQKNNDTFLLLTTQQNETVLYSLKKSKVVHVQKMTTCCSAAGHSVVICRKDHTIVLYNLQTSKSTQFLSLKHELISTQGEQTITNICCNLLWLVMTTSSNKLIVANFSPAIVCTEQFNENINDIALSGSGEIILVGDFGDILIYRLQGTHGYNGMEEEIKKWIQVNDMSWLDGSVWARKKSQRQLSGSVVDSIRLRSSVNNNEKSYLRAELPNVQIKYKTQQNDHSIFNPSDILKQVKQVYNNVSSIQKQKKNNSNVNVLNTQKKQKQTDALKITYTAAESPALSGTGPVNKKIEDDDGIQQIRMNRSKNKPPIPDNETRKQSKKRIFGIASTAQNRDEEKLKQDKSNQNSQQQKGLHSQFNNNLVNSVIHQVPPKPKEQKLTFKNTKPLQRSKKNKVENFNQFQQVIYQPQSNKLATPVREAGQFSNLYQMNSLQKEKETVEWLSNKIKTPKFIQIHHDQLQLIYSSLKPSFQNKQNQSKIDRQQVLTQFSQFANNFIKSISNQILPSPKPSQLKR